MHSMGIISLAQHTYMYTGDSTCDLIISPDNENQYILWAIGGLEQTAFKHFIRTEGGCELVCVCVCVCVCAQCVYVCVCVCVCLSVHVHACVYVRTTCY